MTMVQLGITQYDIEKEKRILKAMYRHRVHNSKISKQKNLIHTLELVGGLFN